MQRLRPWWNEQGLEVGAWTSAVYKGLETGNGEIASWMQVCKNSAGVEVNASVV